MTTRWTSLVFDAADPPGLARWWASALGWELSFENAEESDVMPAEDRRADGQIELCFTPGGDHKVGKNRLHLDLASTSATDQTAQVERLVELGARRADIRQASSVPWVVLADPEGNEFCVLDPRDEYRETGAIAAVVVDAADPAGLAEFWAAATGWPVARRGDNFASLQPPVPGLPFVEFVSSGEPKTVKDRLHLDVAPFAADDQTAEVGRLLAGGATRADIGQAPGSTWVVLADPEGNEFCVLSSRD
jgi:predicted enzyme related to lactoylglutathione lyase